MFSMAVVTQEAKTVGVSPKVYLPVVGMLVAGVVLVLIGLDVEGKTLIGTAIATAGVGGFASPGKVQVP